MYTKNYLDNLSRIILYPSIISFLIESGTSTSNFSPTFKPFAFSFQLFFFAKDPSAITNFFANIKFAFNDFLSALGGPDINTAANSFMAAMGGITAGLIRVFTDGFESVIDIIIGFIHRRA